MLKHIKILLTGGIMLGTIVLGGASAFAADSTASSAPTNTQSTKLAALIAKGDAAIASRIRSLNKLSAQVNKMKYLSSDQKAANVATVTTSVAAMNAAKTKLDADTDLKQAKLDYMAIFNDNRVYAVVVPQVTVASYADNILGSVPAINADLAKIKTRITKAQTAGKDVTAIQAQYADAQAKITDASTQATNAITAAGTLAVDHGNKTIIVSNKTISATIKTARVSLAADLKAARADISSIKKALRALRF